MIFFSTLKCVQMRLASIILLSKENFLNNSFIYLLE